MTEAHTYTFGCPFCGASWTLEQFITAAAGVFRMGDWTGHGECPSCGRQFIWRTKGVLNDKPAAPGWWEGKKRRARKYPPHPCEWCGRTIEGNRRFCSVSCNKKAYYRKTHPVVKYQTPKLSVHSTEKLGKGE
jgi:hypothetical protein